jgi:hypothetical protein
MTNPPAGRLVPTADGSALIVSRTFRAPADEVGAYGPGWEYYLDMLVAARDDLPAPSFDDYYPAMKPYYEALPTQTNPA